MIMKKESQLLGGRGGGCCSIDVEKYEENRMAICMSVALAVTVAGRRGEGEQWGAGMV